MHPLSDRQLRILKYIIDEYIETAEAVGSSTLEKKYPNLGVSPATIRNEMASLTESGYLKQPHTSSGRVPTPNALKLYVSQLMKMKDMSVTDEVGIKAKVWESRNSMDKSLRQATKELAYRTKELAIATDSKGNIFYSGTANILDMPEFFDIDLTKAVLSLLDELDFFNKIFSKTYEEQGIHILLGSDLGNDYLEPCGLIFTKYGDDENSGAIGVIGPYRCNYPVIIPTVKYFGDLMNELVAHYK